MSVDEEQPKYLRFDLDIYMLFLHTNTESTWYNYITNGYIPLAKIGNCPWGWEPCKECAKIVALFNRD